MQSTNIIFMVYDSRSGSTFLSKLISQKIEYTIVTPEIGYEEILKRSRLSLNNTSWIKIIRIMLNNNDMRNINPSFSDTIFSLKKIEGKIPAKIVFNLLLNESLQEFKEQRNIVIKNGRHIKYLQNLSDLMESRIKVLYIERDPRAVISSKLSTKRPYFNYEVMAWGGAFLAAIQWKKYNQYIEDARNKKNTLICEVTYEDLIQNEHETLTKISLFVGSKLNLNKNNKKDTYNIPTSEQSIHKLTTQKAVTSRINGWRKELSPNKIKQVEAVLSREMLKSNYKPDNKLSIIERFLIILLSFPELLYKVVRHYLFRAKYKFLRKAL